MVLYGSDDKKFIKYELSCDVEKLLNLAKRANLECGFIRHQSLTTDDNRFNGSRIIINYSERVIARKDGINLYSCSFDEIEETILSKLIKRFIYEEDLTLISYLNGQIDFRDSFDDILVTVSLLEKDVNETLSKDEIDRVDLRIYLREIDELKSVLELNSNRGNIEEFKEEARELIHFKEIDSLDKDVCSHVKNFFDKSKTTNTLKKQKSKKSI